jgi:hypothetical protein
MNLKTWRCVVFCERIETVRARVCLRACACLCACVFFCSLDADAGCLDKRRISQHAKINLISFSVHRYEVYPGLLEEGVFPGNPR